MQRDIIAAKAQVFWVAQISANLLRDEELVDLIAASGGKWIFIGMESVDPINLKDVNKGFNKPSEYAAVLERLAKLKVDWIFAFACVAYNLVRMRNLMRSAVSAQCRLWCR